MARIERRSRENGEALSDADVEKLRVAFAAPLPGAYALTPGAAQALRWCKACSLRVVLITNTISRGDDEVWRDFERFGLGDLIDYTVSSYSTGWPSRTPRKSCRASCRRG